MDVLADSHEKDRQIKKEVKKQATEMIAQGSSKGQRKKQRNQEAKALNAAKKKETSRWAPELPPPKVVALTAALAAGVAVGGEVFNSAALGDPLRPTPTTFATSKRQKPRRGKAWKQRQQDQEPRARQCL